MKIFLSWSKKPSEDYALAFNDWIKLVLQKIKPFYSPEIDPGSRSINVIFDELKDTSIGILFVTPNNFQEAWLNFEAGAISKGEDKNRVIPLAFDDSFAKLTSPIKEFHAKRFIKEDVLSILKQLNGAEEPTIDISTLTDVFEKNWPDLEKRIKDISDSAMKENIYTAEELRKPDIQDQLDEILVHVRENKSIDKYNLKTLSYKGIKKMEQVFEELYEKNIKELENLNKESFNEVKKKISSELEESLEENGFGAYLIDGNKSFLNSFFNAFMIWTLQKKENKLLTDDFEL